MLLECRLSLVPKSVSYCDANSVKLAEFGTEYRKKKYQTVVE